MKPLSFSEDVEKALQREANEQLKSTWQWMSEILSTLEHQLNMGDEFDTKVKMNFNKTKDQGFIVYPGQSSLFLIEL